MINEEDLFRDEVLEVDFINDESLNLEGVRFDNLEIIDSIDLISSILDTILTLVKLELIIEISILMSMYFVYN